jgi:threonine/homoserine/homoserine lactone efflux protein
VNAPVIFSYLLTCILIELTPGPNMSYLAILTLSRGKRAGLVAVGGVALGLGLVGLLAALGVAQLVNQVPILYGILRWAGILYLLYLAYDSWRDAESEEDPEPRKIFLRGLLNNVLSPKAALFFVAVIPAFLPSTGSLLKQSLFFSAIYVGVATGIHLLIVLLSGYLRTFFADPASMRRARRCMALLLVLVAVWVFFATKP